MKIGICGNISLHDLAAEIDNSFQKNEVITGNTGDFIDELSNPFGDFLDLDVCILALDWTIIIPQLFLYASGDNTEEIKELYIQKVNQLREVLELFRKQSDSKVLIFSPVSIISNPAGFIDRTQTPSFFDFYCEIQSIFNDLCKSVVDLFPIDLDIIFSTIGKINAFDNNRRYCDGYPFSVIATHAIAEQIKQICIQFSKYPLKCIILDLDNTVWGGVVGECGIEGISLGEYSTGKAFKDFQSEIVRLHRQGVILAICSKNNTCDVLEVLENHPHMLIRPDMISSFRINWEDKPNNIVEIAKELNIGLDTIMFIDDMPSERELVKTALPAIEVLELPDNPFLFSSALQGCSRFWPLQITADDRKKGIYLHQDRLRVQAKELAASIDSYLLNSQITVSITRSSAVDLPRIVQLFNKTNQFNLTTKRYSSNQLEKLIENSNNHLFHMSMKDKYGDYGIIATALTTGDTIDSFILSCRAFGKKAENAFVHYILNYMLQEGHDKIYGEYIPTLKNHMTEYFYKSVDFTFDHQLGNRYIWFFSFENGTLPKKPEWINVN